jgi:hypothetical protein
MTNLAGLDSCLCGVYGVEELFSGSVESAKSERVFEVFDFRFGAAGHYADDVEPDLAV